MLKCWLKNDGCALQGQMIVCGGEQWVDSMEYSNLVSALLGLLPWETIMSAWLRVTSQFFCYMEGDNQRMHLLC